MRIPRLLLLIAGVSFVASACCNDSSLYNVAENKAAWASSSYDYNLTAQLATDGRLETGEPAWLRVSTPEGELPRREKEWTVDKGPYSKSTLSGEDTFIEYEWSRQSFVTRVIRVTGYVLHREGASSWSVGCFAATDGGAPEKIGSVGSASLPGVASGAAKVTDPNKQDEVINLPRRRFCLEIPIDAVAFSHLKLVFRMKGAVSWMISAVDFADGDGFGENTDSFGIYQSGAARGQNVLPSECFTSAWMSEDGQPQWIYVDLQKKQKVSRVRLHWIHKPAEGVVEFSDNGEDWKKAAALPSTDSLVYNVAAKGVARYVRVSMSGADESGHFCLGEMEVLGPEAPEYAKSAWMLQRASDVAASGEEISTKEYSAEGWLPAVVPGTVLYSYIAAGSVPEPAYSDNNNQISESFFNSDFWYRGVVEQEGGSGERSLLEFDGVNWKAEMFMDGKRVGDIAGAFKKGIFDVSDIVRASASGSGSGSGKHIVAVHIVKNANFAAVKEKNAESPDFNGGALGADNPTFHATVGWDWIPTVRGREMGIWNDVRLVASNRWSLRNPLVESKIAADGKASVKAGVELANLSSEALTGTLEGAIGPMTFSKEVTVEAGETATVVFSPEDYASLKDQQVELWWPNGYGEPTLHESWYRFTPSGSQPSAEQSSGRHGIDYLAGIREFTYSDVFSDLKMFINGRRFFPKGGNWGFSEFNLRYGANEYDMAVGFHREMNLNMIRNWVGQTGDEEFYQACDKYGIVVWQDFWLANPCDGPDPDDEDMFADNAQDYVRRIRSHACVGLYCGRNEGYPPASLNARLAGIVKELHGDIVYIPNSADDGVSGHGPYRAVNPDSYFGARAPKFHSERGMPAVMTYASLVNTFSKDHLWPFDDVWGQHDFTMTGAQGDEAFIEMVRKGFGEKALKDAESFAKYAQWINYDGYRAMYEANNVMLKGLLIWMSHSCWPSLAWQTYDYWFNRNGAFYGTMKACEPLHVQIDPSIRTVQVVNASCGDQTGLEASVEIEDASGKVTYSKTSGAFELSEYQTADVIDISDVPDGIAIVTLRLFNGDGVQVSENVYLKNYESGVNTGDYTAAGDKVIDKLLATLIPDCY